MNTTLESWFRWATASGEDEGQGMVEYALILVLIAIACIAALTLVGADVLRLWEFIEDRVLTALTFG